MRIWERIKRLTMKRVFLRDQSLNTKLFIFSGLLVVVPMLLIGLISYRESSKVLEDEAKQYSLQIINQVKHYVEDYFRDFEINTLKILNHPDTVRFLKMENPDDTERTEIHRSVRNVLINSAYSRSDVSNITIIKNKIQISSDQVNDIDLNDAEELKLEHWYSTIPNTGGSKFISRIIPWKDRNEPVISIVRRIVNPYTLEPFGMLIIDVNYKRLQDVTRKVTIGETGFLFVLDDLGHYIYHPDFSLIGNKAEIVDYEFMLDSPNGSLITTSDQKNFLTYSFSSMLDWRLVTSIPYQELMRGTNYIGRTILISIIFTLIIAYILGIGFASSLVRPLKKLQDDMRKVEKGDFSVRVEIKAKDEIGLVSHGFNKMVERLSDMLNEILHSRLKESEMNLRQRETELKVLQSQMNPHFLYNSLETIRGMALEKDMDDIALMSSSLARLMRYNLKETSSTVSIQQEIGICEVYLRIQKYRFEEKLEYEFIVPEWAKDQKVAKFSLQPLIENCIIHGLEPSAEVTKVCIKAVRDSAHSFIIEISDTGVGITPERLTFIRDNLNHRMDITSGGAHIGVINVHQRNQFIFGELYGLFVESTKEQGTLFTLRLPYVNEARLQGGGEGNAQDSSG